MEAKRWKPGLSIKEKENLHPIIKRFVKSLEDIFGNDNFVITSGYRKGSKKRHGKEEGAEAIDIRPTEKLYDYLQNTKEGLELLKDHGLGFLDERSPEAQKKYKATGANFHIGMDNTLESPDVRLAKMASGEMTALDAEYILSQKNDDYRTDALNDYDKKKKEIEEDQSLLISEREAKKQKLNKDAYLKGELDIVNKRAEEENEKKLAERKEKEKDFKEFKNLGGMVYGVLDKVEVVEEKTARRTKYDQNQKDISELSPEERKKQTTSRESAKSYRLIGPSDPYMKRLIKALPKDQKKLISKDKLGYIIRHEEDFRKFVDHADKEYESITGKHLYFPTASNSRKNLVYDFQNDIQNRKADFTIPKKELSPVIPITPEWIKEKEEQDIKGTVEPVVEPEVEEEKKDAPQSKEDNFKERSDAFFDSLIDKEEIIVPDSYIYDKKDFSHQFPTGAIGQALLALKGMDDAKTPLPLRDEQVSEAILNFARENKKISEMGLRPEEEAKMKSDLAGAYQEYTTRIVRASGGNRNLVLGNQQTANLARIQGLSNIALADLKAKDAAFARYGQTLQYINDFNTNRKIANHKIKFDEAQQTRQAGAQLAASGFANMLEEIQFQKENGPGSANHAFNSMMNNEIFGQVAGMEDNGKPGSASYKKKWVENLAKSNALAKKYNDAKQKGIQAYNALDDKSKSEIDKKEGGLEAYMESFLQEKQQPNRFENAFKQIEENPFKSKFRESRPKNPLIEEDTIQDLFNKEDSFALGTDDFYASLIKNR